ncbi:MAG: hypothetical protein M1821_003368 [Bathelium mastoideum]|nr:MAG: hypothetical protein M1821_003368 [Bathelium mastoideum]KAI9686078.1 MAG: hypothetical protein M1822_004061 [Bathelium mastoideum]
MKTSTTSVLALAALASAQSTNAPFVSTNPAGSMYTATFPNLLTNFIRGRVVASSPFGGPVNLAINIANLPQGAGPFEYHIHEFPVPANGDCTGTGAHLDPYNRGEQPPCDASQPQTCQVGDLSGKHGKINGTAIATSYTAPYTSTTIGSPAFLGNRSIVVHANNGTRIACASFVTYLVGGNSSSTGGGLGSGNGTTNGTGFGGSGTPGSGSGGATNVPPKPFPTATRAPVATANPNAGARTAVSTGFGIAVVAAVMVAFL